MPVALLPFAFGAVHKRTDAREAVGGIVLCVALIAGIVFFGVAPTGLVDAYYAALASINLPL